jgi:hypothetical protein
LSLSLGYICRVINENELFDMKNIKYGKKLLLLISLATAIRCIIAYFVDLGGEEAYCWSFALFPKLSYLEGTPVVGWLIQLTTCNLAFNNEFFVRLGAIFTSAICTWLIYLLGKRICNQSAGFYAAVLYTASLFCSVTQGLFIGPQTPQLLFVLLSLYFLHEGLIVKYYQGLESRNISNLSLIMGGIFIGISTLSHISSILLWAGAFVYILLFERKTLGRPYLYLSLLITFIIILPLFSWHDTRLFLGTESSLNHLVNFSNPFKELIVNNPINLLIITLSLLSYKHLNKTMAQEYRLFLSLSLPLLATGNFAIGLIPLFIIAAISYETELFNSKFKHFKHNIFNYSLLFSVIIVAIFLLHIYVGFFNLEFKKSDSDKVGYNYNVLKHYGMQQLSSNFSEIRNNDIATGKMSTHSSIIADNVYDAARINYYIAYPEKMTVNVIGSPSNINKYIWITDSADRLEIGESAYFIENSEEKNNAQKIGNNFKKMEIAGNIYIHRFGKPIGRYTLYRFKELEVIPRFDAH